MASVPLPFLSLKTSFWIFPRSRTADSERKRSRCAVRPGLTAPTTQAAGTLGCAQQGCLVAREWISCLPAGHVPKHSFLM